MEKSDFKNYVMESNPVLGLILNGRLLVEKHLIDQIETGLHKPEILLRGNGLTFSMLVNVNEACGLIGCDLAKVFRALNSLRNKYAHKFSFVANENQVKDFLKTLRNMNEPFFISDLPATEKELCIGLAALSGWLERNYGKILQNA